METRKHNSLASFLKISSDTYWTTFLTRPIPICDQIEAYLYIRSSKYDVKTLSLRIRARALFTANAFCFLWRSDHIRYILKSPKMTMRL
ncbi:unnamed protein product [Acanthoscelides obtectus]|uniref:Uncharacterized protein n=1 Tax=Acanthoscelides obtectus TaxID=200917 RepID=A0A9P0PVF0_ACAOB|nr:unnamed protein product [Acanthoscelides obtectus]CAK1632720.1 hypothetical protein AOBTE_LOCUS7693 [Acanthoscelides obtectus]